MWGPYFCIDAGGATVDYANPEQSGTAPSVKSKLGISLLFGVLESSPEKQLKQRPVTADSSLKLKAGFARVKAFKHIHFGFALLYVNTYMS